MASASSCSPARALSAFEVKTGVKRGPSSPEVENTVKGPKDAFVETIRVSTSLIRRHLRTPDLRLYETKAGRRSLTNATVAWVEGITNPELVKRMKRRLDTMDTLTAFCRRRQWRSTSPVPAPRRFRCCNTRSVPTASVRGCWTAGSDCWWTDCHVADPAPATLGYLLESPEDRGRDYVLASCIRILRYGALLTGLLLPAIYIAFVSFHQDWIPQQLLNIILLNKRNGAVFHSGGGSGAADCL